MAISYDSRGNIKPSAPGFLHSETIKYADEILKDLPKSPFRLLDCWLCCVKLEEKTAIPGFIIREAEYSKDRESQYVVLDSGPGWRVKKGITEMNVETGQVVATGIKRGDIIQCVERIVHPVEHQGETFHFVESHRVLFVIEKE